MSIDVIDHPGAPKPAHPAATVVLLRDGADGLEVLMIRRSSRTAFGGMWAFPGGRIEDEDVPLGTAPDPLPAAVRAAVRETSEEVGLTLEEDSLRFLSHWLPPANAPVRFSTWCFAAPAPEGLVAIDEDEVHDHRWMRPADAIASHRAGEIELVTPTFVTLHLLGTRPSAAAALSISQVEFFATQPGKLSNGVRVCLYEGDVAYGTSKRDCDAPGTRRRLVMDDDTGWVWQDTRSA